MAMLLAVWAVGGLRGAVTIAVPFARIRFIAWPFIAVVVWMIVQQLPLGGLLAHPLWGEAAVALGRGKTVYNAISIAPYEGRVALMRLASYGIAFWLALQLARDESIARNIVRYLTLAYIAYATLGLVYHTVGIERILWIPKWAYIGDATGTFVNRNAYGAQMALGAVLCLAQCLRVFRKQTTAEVPLERLRRLALSFWWLLGYGLCFSALLASHSRGALLSCLVAALILTLVLVVFGAIRLRSLAWTIGSMVLVGLALFLTGGEVTLQRFMQGNEFQGDRPNLVHLSWLLVQGAPWMGYGLGAFEPAFGIVRDTSLPRAVVYDYAHNMYMEALVELGIPATLLWFTGFLAIAWRCLMGMRQRRQGRTYPAIGLATLALFGCHSLVDFSIAMPALALTVAILLGIACAQSWSSRDTIGRQA